MSLIAFSAARSRFAAWLALLAIVLLFVAPVISKSLAQTHGPTQHTGHPPLTADTGHAGSEHPVQADAMPVEHQMAGPMPHQMPGMMDHQMSGMMAGMMMPHPPQSMMDDSACGYCVLLVHLSLVLAVVALLWSRRQAAAAPDVPLFQPLPARIVPHFFHPRAPPAPFAFR